jgi:hypothetical protein
MYLSDAILIESKSARDDRLFHLSDTGAKEILNKVKFLLFALWQGVGIATTEQVAEFYEVDAATIRQVFKRHRDEFTPDGLQVLRGDAFQNARDILSLASKTSQAVIWTPRATLRLGMLLRDSEIAKQVRTALLDLVEVMPLMMQVRNTLNQVMEHFQPLQELVNYSRHSCLVDDITLNQVRKAHPNGIPGMTENEFRDRLVLLSSRTNEWKLHIEKEFRYNFEDFKEYRYPDLFTKIFTVQTDEQPVTVHFLLDCKDPFVTIQDIHECLYARQYLWLDKEATQADFSFLLFVAPFGGTPSAYRFMAQEIREVAYQGRVGIVTVEQMTRFLLNRVSESVENKRKKQEITEQYKPLLNYLPRLILPIDQRNQVTGLLSLKN